MTIHLQLTDNQCVFIKSSTIPHTTSYKVDSQILSRIAKIRIWTDDKQKNIRGFAPRIKEKDGMKILYR